MKIRSITYFTNPGWPLSTKKLRLAGEFLAEARTAFEGLGYEVQTTRLATVSFARILSPKKITQAPRLAEQLETAVKDAGIAYASLGPALPEFPESYSIIPEAIAASQNIFFSGVMAENDTGVDLNAVKACAEIIVRCSTITPDGFANLRFAALANVPPVTPFFPAAYHEGDLPAFAIAAEAADLAVQAFDKAQSIEEGREALINMLEEHARQFAPVAELLKFRYNARYGGIDFSLAPFPTKEQSIGTALEKLGVPRAGMHGSLAAAAILTEAVDRANFPRSGFSGLFLPVLEDAVLADRAAEGTLTIKDLLMYSAVCGTGLDTVPLPGDVSAGEIAPLLLDLSALALRLDKPLTARLMPIPGKKAGDPTGFDFAFFANSRVMALESGGLGQLLAGKETFKIRARGKTVHRE